MKPTKKLNRVKKAAAFAVVFVLCCLLFAVPAFAAEGTGGDVTTVMSNFTNLMFMVIRIVGICVTAFAVFQFATALKSHDGAQKAQAGLGIAAGLLIIFVKEILTLIGVPMS